KKARAKKREPSVVQREMASTPPPTQLSIAAAQAMAVSAPLPEYPYEAKHANITGSGVCLMLVDIASGTVTKATMTQSTGNRVVDKVTTDTFRRWRFKPGSVSQVRVPVTYEYNRGPFFPQNRYFLRKFAAERPAMTMLCNLEYVRR